jgi:ATP-dependent RNA circularization protein (DNA/RNA ligase family)
MLDFFKFPHTPHIDWLGKGQPREDKVLSMEDAQRILKSSLIVEEKIDGANLGISLDQQGQLQPQNRGQYLIQPYRGQFSRLESWLSSRKHSLEEQLGKHLILFGEWCAARHSLDYSKLPDWFIVFDVYDRMEQRFWSTQRRDQLAKKLALPTVPKLFTGSSNLDELKEILINAKSQYRSGSLEGIVIRQESTEWLEKRAKLVRADFTQSIEKHWASRPIEWNRIG